jgi:pteridine reductase
MDANIIPKSEIERFPLAVVTGAGHRLGKGFALSLARMGYAVVLHYFRSREKVIEVENDIRSIGVPVFKFQADLSDPDGVQQLFDYIDTLVDESSGRVGKLEIFINSAAVMLRMTADKISVKEFDEMMNLNLRAPFFCSQKSFLQMGAGGLIVNISDIAASKAWVGYPAYTISKAGMDSMTRVLARSFAPLVRVNAIALGLALRNDDFPSAEWDKLVERLPVRREPTIDELTGALNFLIENKYIIGQTLVIDGGFSLL